MVPDFNRFASGPALFSSSVEPDRRPRGRSRGAIRPANSVERHRMTRKSLFALLIAAALPSAHAAPGGAPAADKPVAPLAVTADEVGDADSFGRVVRWLGLLSGYGRLSADCSADPGDTSPCQTIAPAPATTTFDFPDLDVLVLPARASTSLLCHSQTPVTTWFALNATGSAQDMLFRVTPYYRIESEVLVGLSDPNTGVPYNGVIELGLTGLLTSQTLQPGESVQDLDTGTRACIGGLVSKQSLTTSYGLTDAQAEQFFRRPITIRYGLRGSARLVEDASINYGTRFYGD